MGRHIYYGTFTPGLQRPVETMIRERLPDVTIQKLLDGAVMFETAVSYDRLNFFCFNNIFAVVSVADPADAENALEDHIRLLCGRREAGPVIAENNGKIRTFRIVCSQENRPSAVNEKLRASAEKYIAGHSGLAVDRTRPDTEFWFLYRREGFSVCMKRLTRHGSFEKTLHPGELPPPLAYTLCRLSEPRHTDFAADPFCGYGSIAFQRVKRFPFAGFYAADIDHRAVSLTRQKLGGVQGVCRVERAAVEDISAFIPEKSLDKIITDPPWGMYEKTPIIIEEFYRDMIHVFERLIKPGGVAVVLTARADALSQAVSQSAFGEKPETIPVLVSGKKACIFKLRNAESPEL